MILLEEAISFFGELPHPFLQKEAVFFQSIFIDVPGDKKRFSPKIGHFAKGQGEDEMIPARKYLFARSTVGYRQNRGAGLTGQLHNPHLDDVPGALGAIRGNGEIGASAEKTNHSSQSGNSPPGCRTTDRIHSEKLHNPSNEFAIHVLTDHNSHPALPGDKRHHQQPLMPEGQNDRLILIPKFLRIFRKKNLLANGETEKAKNQEIEPRGDMQKNIFSKTPPVHGAHLRIPPIGVSAKTP